eukprot:28621-Pyramimonas_sp.AAC.1
MLPVHIQHDSAAGNLMDPRALKTFVDMIREGFAAGALACPPPPRESWSAARRLELPEGGPCIRPGLSCPKAARKLELPEGAGSFAGAPSGHCT